MRWLVLLLVACGTSPSGPTTPYLADRDYRRDQLERSLVNPSNSYSQLRLQNYAVDGGWDDLPEWSPDDLDLDIDPTDEAALVALGEKAFFGYPVQELPDAALAGSYGTWSDPVRGNGGMVRYTRPDGSAGVGGACATCHASIRSGALVVGVANEHFDLGRAAVDAGWVASPDVSAHLAWGPGRVDVTTIGGFEPVRIPDLRPIRLQTHLQADATVAQLDRDVLAIRIETLIITTHPGGTRPPRIISLALAAYLWSLADALPASDPPDVFVQRCAGCHAPPALTGLPVALEVVGTDPTVGLSAVRGTGTYRVPSLHGVGQRALLLHDGSLPSLDAMFDPARTLGGYTGGVRLGPIHGHVYGLDLSDSDRADLLAYVEAL